MNKTNMEKVKYRYNRWRLALGRLVNLRYINRWIIFCADLFISLCVSLIGVLGLLSIMHVYISGISGSVSLSVSGAGLSESLDVQI